MLGTEEANNLGGTNTLAKTPCPGADPKDLRLELMVRRIINFSLLLIFMGSFTIFFVGASSLEIKNEISNDESFVKLAEEMRPDFENSLLLYTGKTQEIINFLLNLRPQKEEDFIAFITALENVGKKLSLKLEIKTLDVQEKDNTKSKDNNSISYIVNFYGSTENLHDFVNSLDELPYYIKISSIRYENPISEEGKNEKSKKLPNISMELQLFIKTKNANK